jgi:site-specific DNA-methyltransferase (adenine-specific)
MKTSIIGSATLHHMDCMEFMSGLPDKAFDLAIVDPPYGISIGENKSGMGRRKGNKKAAYDMGDWDSSPPEQAYFDEMRRVSKNQIVWGANHFIDMLPMRSPCWIVWDKLFSNEVTFAAVELAWTSFGTTAKKFCLSPLQDGRIHPTQKPVKLYEWLLTNYAKPGNRILDTHLGSGSSAIAANNLGFEFVGMELDTGYFEAACKRVKQATSQDTLFAPAPIVQMQEVLL